MNEYLLIVVMAEDEKSHSTTGDGETKSREEHDITVTKLQHNLLKYLEKNSKIVKVCELTDGEKPPETIK